MAHDMNSSSNNSTAPALDARHRPKDMSDKIAYGLTKVMRWFADTFFRKRYGHQKPAPDAG
nr:alternative oxidase [Hyphomonas sp. 34-62-18]